MESLHPGSEGNPAFSDITHPVMRAVFYLAVLAFFLVGWLLYTQRVRLGLIVRRMSYSLRTRPIVGIHMAMFMPVHALIQAGVDEALLSNEKLPVVLAVVLIIWLGLSLYILRTDKRIRQLEKALEKDNTPSSS